MNKDAYSARNRSYTEIRRSGAIGNLNEGLVMFIQGIETKVIASPLNGFQTESVHIQTYHPGDELTRKVDALVERSLLCLEGAGEVYLHGQWMAMSPGDIAYLPVGVEHGVRGRGKEDFIVLTVASPPPFDSYGPHFYDAKQGIKFEVVQKAIEEAPRGNLSPEFAFRLPNDTDRSSFSAENLSPHEIAHHGALFHVLRGAKAGALVRSTVFILWPGYGSSKLGYNSAYINNQETSLIHKHPVSDECLVNLSSKPIKFYCGDRWIDAGPLDCVLAPCGVAHGAQGMEDHTFLGGWASPPQIDVYARTPLYRAGSFHAAPFDTLD